MAFVLVFFAAEFTFLSLLGGKTKKWHYFCMTECILDNNI